MLSNNQNDARHQKRISIRCLIFLLRYVLFVIFKLYVSCAKGLCTGVERRNGVCKLPFLSFGARKEGIERSRRTTFQVESITGVWTKRLSKIMFSFFWCFVVVVFASKTHKCPTQIRTETITGEENERTHKHTYIRSGLSESEIESIVIPFKNKEKKKWSINKNCWNETQSLYKTYIYIYYYYYLLNGQLYIYTYIKHSFIRRHYTYKNKNKAIDIATRKHNKLHSLAKYLDKFEWTTSVLVCVNGERNARKTDARWCKKGVNTGGDGKHLTNGETIMARSSVLDMIGGCVLCGVERKKKQQKHILKQTLVQLNRETRLFTSA